MNRSFDIKNLNISIDKILSGIVMLFGFCVIWYKYSFETMILFILFLFSVTTIISNGITIFYTIKGDIKFEQLSVKFLYLVFSTLIVMILFFIVFSGKITLYIISISFIVLLAFLISKIGKT